MCLAEDSPSSAFTSSCAPTTKSTSHTHLQTPAVPHPTKPTAWFQWNCRNGNTAAEILMRFSWEEVWQSQHLFLSSGVLEGLNSGFAESTVMGLVQCIQIMITQKENGNSAFGQSTRPLDFHDFASYCLMPDPTKLHLPQSQQFILCHGLQHLS